ncbi:MAG: hypothetical protein ACOCQN_00425, partial [Halanaerobiaceae bacterium]
MKGPRLEKAIDYAGMRESPNVDNSELLLAKINIKKYNYGKVPVRELSMEYQYRPYKPSDLNKCTELAVGAWPVLSIITGRSLHDIMEVYVRVSLLLSDYTEVCCQKGKVIGFLFGTIDDNS